MRPIDADVLIVELEKDEEMFDREAEDGKQNPQNCTAGYAEAMWSRANGIRDAIISVYDAPTIDVVEVVRCRDCKHSEVLGKSLIRYCAHSIIPMIRDDDGYCSCGERRTE